MSPANLPGFDLFVPPSHFPLSTYLSGPHIPVPLYARDNVCDEMDGFISRVALEPYYKKLEDAYAQRLGYTTGKWPLVPLRGAVVSDHPRLLLELYEKVSQFSSAAATRSYLHVLAGEMKFQKYHQLPASQIPSGDSVGWRNYTDLGSNEYVFWAFGHRGDFVFEMFFQGGRLLSWQPTADRLWEQAASLASRVPAASGRPAR
jgi:hypothetical protein